MMDSDTMKSSPFSSFLGRYATVLAWIALFIVFSIIAQGFFSFYNLISLLRQISMLAIITCGLTICIIARDWDLSVGRVAGLAGLVAVSLIDQAGAPVWLGILAALCVGAIIGCINGVLITIVGIPSLIVTLAMMTILYGVSLTWTNGQAIYATLPKAFTYWGAGYVGFIPTPILVMLTVVFLSWILLNKTKMGRHIYAIGGNKVVAGLAGISVDRQRFLNLVICGVLAAVAGVILMGRLGSGQPTAGGGFMLEGLGSVFLGITTIKVGKPNILGSMVGVLIMGTLSNGLTVAGMPAYPQEIVKGSVMIIAVLFAVWKTEITI